jgi:formylglycine-generating enzyme required for sulfatase activity
MLQFIMPSILLAGLLLSGCQNPTDPEEQVSRPVINPAAGTYYNPIDVVITSSTLGTTILYTTDGSEPNPNSQIYTGPIEVSQTTILKAKAYRTGMKDSVITTASYTIETTPPANDFVFVQGGTIYPTDGIYTAGLTVSDFYIEKYELTNAEWVAVMGSRNSENYPQSGVSWYGAIEYCNRRSLKDGLTPCYSYLTYGTNPDDWPSGWDTSLLNSMNVTCEFNANGYRLPTDAEWEYAARGGLRTHGYTYSGSNVLNEVGWYDGNSGYICHPVGQLAPNELGLYDMSGNLIEWCGSQIDGYGRVVRGGDFIYYDYTCSVSYQIDYYTISDFSFVGFRICRNSPGSR